MSNCQQCSKIMLQKVKLRCELIIAQAARWTIRIYFLHAANKIRCRGHSKYVLSLFDKSYFYKMKAVINFSRWGGSAPPYPPGWGYTPDPAFLQWHKELNGLTCQYKKLKTNQAIILVNFSILEVTDTIFATFCKSNQMQYLEK